MNGEMPADPDYPPRPDFGTDVAEAPREKPVKSKRKGWMVVVGIVLVLILAALALKPLVMRRTSRCPDMPEVVFNARQIGIALYEFQQEYGKMPDVDTANQLSKSNDGVELGKRTSNDFFRQLFAVDITRSEQMFYARIPGSRKPDGNVTGSKLLEKGECGFSYFLGATKDCNPKRPIAATPMISGSDRFDPKPFDGKAVVLMAENSVISLPIDNQGHVLFKGRNLMDPANPLWEGKPPAIAWPDL